MKRIGLLILAALLLTLASCGRVEHHTLNFNAAQQLGMWPHALHSGGIFRLEVSDEIMQEMFDGSGLIPTRVIAYYRHNGALRGFFASAHIDGVDGQHGVVVHYGDIPRHPTFTFDATPVPSVVSGIDVVAFVVESDFSDRVSFSAGFQFNRRRHWIEIWGFRQSEGADRLYEMTNFFIEYGLNLAALANPNMDETTEIIGTYF